MGNRIPILCRLILKKKENNYEVSIDLPGFQKDEINAELKDGYLIISAVKNVNNDEKDKDGNISDVNDIQEI